MTMMPRLEAQEMLNQSTAMALGSGSMKRVAAQRLVRDLQRQAQPASSRGRAPKADPAVLASMGIKVEQV